MKPGAIAWDVDGTLVDSEPLHLRALLDTCQRYGLDLSGEPDARFLGKGIVEVWEVLRPRLPEGTPREEWLDAICSFYRREAGTLQLREGAEEILLHLAGQGLPQVAVSNSHRSIVDANLGLFSRFPGFRFSLALEEVPAPKPDPAPYRTAAERLGLSPAEVVVVEDSPSGLRSSRAAGCSTVGLRTPGLSLPEEAADLWIDRLIDLPAAIGLPAPRFPHLPPQPQPNNPTEKGPT